MSKNRKIKNRQNYHEQAPQFQLRKVSPLTINQEATFDAYDQGYNLILHGYAGTGKTYISLYKALQSVLAIHPQYEKVILVRSAVPSRDVGFLPGSIKDKIRIYEDPYREICDDLFGTKNAYDFLKMKGVVDFCPSSFLRGITFNNSIVIIDEGQNFTFQEMDTVITRIGNNSKLIICGDFRQTDLNKPHEREGISQILRIIDKMDCFRHIEFEKGDIVRSGLVKEYLIEKSALGL